jgi:hypothetical protein
MAPPSPKPLVVLGAFVVSAIASLAACSGAPPEDAPTGSTSSALSGNDKAAYEFFIGKGLKDFQAAGIIGNLDQESSDEPGSVQFGGGPGRGIAQWSVGGRWNADTDDNVAWYAAHHGASEWSLDLQLEFVWYELTSFGGYGLGELRGSKDVSEATVAFETRFEGCGECDQGTRIAFAQTALNAFRSLKPPSSGPSGTPTAAVVKRADGWLEAFERGGGNALDHVWQESQDSGRWSAWAGLSGDLASDVAGIVNREGREEVFAVASDKAVVHNWIKSDGEWSGWSSLGGELVGDVAVILDQDQNTRVFARGPNAELYVASESAESSWSNWESLGGSITSNASVAMNQDGRLEVFAVGDKDVAYHQWQTTSGGWSGWHSLGGALSGKPTAVTDTEGKIRVFGVGTNGDMYLDSQVTPGGDWTGWKSLGGKWTSHVAVGVNADGRLEVFARGTDDRLYHAWQSEVGGELGGFASLGGKLTSHPSVALNKEGGLEVFARGSNGALFHAWQDKQGWSSWASLGGSVE